MRFVLDAVLVLAGFYCGVWFASWHHDRRVERPLTDRWRNEHAYERKQEGDH